MASKQERLGAQSTSRWLPGEGGQQLLEPDQLSLGPSLGPSPSGRGQASPCTCSCYRSWKQHETPGLVRALGWGLRTTCCKMMKPLQSGMCAGTSTAQLLPVGRPGFSRLPVTLPRGSPSLDGVSLPVN